jgi:hypothetical protein
MIYRVALFIAYMLILVIELAVHFWFVVSLLFNTERALAIVLAYDRLGNVAMGQGNETVSSWAGRRNSWLEKPINFLFKILTGETNHCDSHLEK